MRNEDQVGSWLKVGRRDARSCCLVAVRLARLFTRIYIRARRGKRPRHGCDSDDVAGDMYGRTVQSEAPMRRASIRQLPTHPVQLGNYSYLHTTILHLVIRQNPQSYAAISDSPHGESVSVSGGTACQDTPLAALRCYTLPSKLRVELFGLRDLDVVVSQKPFPHRVICSSYTLLGHVFLRPPSLHHALCTQSIQCLHSVHNAIYHFRQALERPP